jgi:hypothetical protein
MRREACSSHPISGILTPLYMAYWIIKTHPDWNDFPKFPIEAKDN